MGHVHIFILILLWVGNKFHIWLFSHYFTHLVKISRKAMKWFKNAPKMIICDEVVRKMFAQQLLIVE